MSLQHQLLNYAGATGAGAPPSPKPIAAGGKAQQALAPKPAPGGSKKRQIAPTPPPAQPSGPGPGAASPRLVGPVQIQPRPVVMAPHQHPTSALQEQLQVAGAPQPASSVLQPTAGDHVVIQSSSSPALKPSSMLPSAASDSGMSATLAPSSASAPTTVLVTPSSLSAASTSPGQQFPLIHQALQGDGAPSGGKQGAAAMDQGNDTNLIKSLLAKKVCQNMVRQGNSTPSQSPPPQEFGCDSPISVASESSQPQQQQQQPPQPQPMQQDQQQQQPSPMLQAQLEHAQSQLVQQQQLQQQQQQQQQQLQQQQQQQLQQQKAQPQLVQQHNQQVHIQQHLLQQQQTAQPQVVQQPHPVQQQTAVNSQLQVHLQQQPQIQLQAQQQHNQPQVLQAQQHGQPQVLQAQQQHGQPQVLQAQVAQHSQPQVLQAQHGQPQVLQAQQGQPQVLQAQQHGKPQVLQAQQHGQPQVLQAQHGQPQVLQAQQQVAQHGQPQVLQAQPHLQQVLHLQQGQQVVLHQQPGQQHQPQQIHIQQRVSGQQPTLQLQHQQIVLQANPQQQVHIRPQQQIILQQHQQHVVIQGQPTLQQILHQPVQQLHIQPSQHLQIQGQGQPLRIQTQGQQPMVIQLPVYQLPQMATSQMATVCATSLPTTLVQTTACGLPQTTVVPYRAIIPHPTVSVPSTMSSHRHHVPEAGQQSMMTTKQKQDGEQVGMAGDSVTLDSARLSVQQGVRVLGGGGGGALHGALNTPSQPGEAAVGDSRTVAQPLRDSLLAQGILPSIPAAPAVQTLLSPGLPSSRALTTTLSFSSSSVLPHATAVSSFPCSTSYTLSSQRMPILQSSSMSITQAILSGHDVHKAGSNHPHAIRSPAESHQHAVRDGGQVNGNNNVSVPANKECNGLSETSRADLSQGRGEVNGILGSPDSVSSDLPPSPMEGVKVSQDHLPNGLAESSVNSLKECASQRSKEFLLSMAEKAGRLNGVVHHMENGDIKFSASQDKMEGEQGWRVPQPGEKVEMEVDAEKKLELWQVNGLSGHSGTKENHTATSPLPHRDREQVFTKQTSMEEVSLDSTDSKLVVNGSKAGDSGGRPLFSPDGSHDSDLSCDSFASSIADSVNSDKHSSLAQHSFPKPSSSAPSPSPVFPEVPLVLAGTIPMSEAVNKRNKKKSTPKPKTEKPPSKSRKRKGSGAGDAPAGTSAAPAAAPAVEYMCEWAGCRR